MRVVVDTSVWSLALRRQRRNLTPPQRAIGLLLRDLIIEGDAILLGVVRQELLTGITVLETFEAIRHHLRSFDDDVPDVDDYERAAGFGNACTRAGISATTVDMLICAVASGRDLPILTTDDDFDRYAQHLPIKLYPHP
jgi:predicted nucleic acid-binding protein